MVVVAEDVGWGCPGCWQGHGVLRSWAAGSHGAVSAGGDTAAACREPAGQPAWGQPAWGQPARHQHLLRHGESCGRAGGAQWGRGPGSAPHLHPAQGCSCQSVSSSSGMLLCGCNPHLLGVQPSSMDATSRSGCSNPFHGCCPALAHVHPPHTHVHPLSWVQTPLKVFEPLLVCATPSCTCANPTLHLQPHPNLCSPPPGCAKPSHMHTPLHTCVLSLVHLLVP